MKTSENNNEWTLSFAIPKWIAITSWYVLILFSGSVMGWGCHAATISVDKEEVYNKGKEEGRASCIQPSRLEKGFGGVTHWLSSPGD